MKMLETDAYPFSQKLMDDFTSTKEIGFEIGHITLPIMIGSAINNR